MRSEFPWNSPYAFSENDVIGAVELESLERLRIADAQWYSPGDGAKLSRPAFNFQTLQEYKTAPGGYIEMFAKKLNMSENNITELVNTLNVVRDYNTGYQYLSVQWHGDNKKDGTCRAVSHEYVGRSLIPRSLWLSKKIETAFERKSMSDAYGFNVSLNSPYKLKNGSQQITIGGKNYDAYFRFQLDGDEKYNRITGVEFSDHRETLGIGSGGI